MNMTNDAPNRPAESAGVIPLEPFVNGQAKPAPEEGRNAGGRFTKGWKGGPGNPFARKVAALRKAALEEITEDDIRGLFRQWHKKAMDGDIAAGALLAKYTLGRPPQGPDPDGLDADEWNRFRNMPSRAEVCLTFIDAIPEAQGMELAEARVPRTLDEAKKAIWPTQGECSISGYDVREEMTAKRRRRSRSK
jgi:hypothetical protein